jgi:hypothetical protein
MWSDGRSDDDMARDLQATFRDSHAGEYSLAEWIAVDGQTITFDQMWSSRRGKLSCIDVGKLARLQSASDSIRLRPALARSIEGSIRNLTRDLGGVTSHDRMELGHLTINRADRHSWPRARRDSFDALEPRLVQSLVNSKPQVALPAQRRSEFLAG